MLDQELGATGIRLSRRMYPRVDETDAAGMCSCCFTPGCLTSSESTLRQARFVKHASSSTRFGARRSAWLGLRGLVPLWRAVTQGDARRELLYGPVRDPARLSRGVPGASIGAFSSWRGVCLPWGAGAITMTGDGAPESFLPPSAALLSGGTWAGRVTSDEEFLCMACARTGRQAA